jgi:hypothetical protein
VGSSRRFPTYDLLLNSWEHISLIHLAFMKLFFDLGFEFYKLIFDFQIQETFLLKRATGESRLIWFKAVSLYEKAVNKLRIMWLSKFLFVINGRLGRISLLSISLDILNTPALGRWDRTK